MMKTLKEISYEYAQLRGGGLPLTAEEICNCVVQWVQQYTQEQISPSGETLNKIRTATYEAISAQLPIRLSRRESDDEYYNLTSIEFDLDIQDLLQRIEAIDLLPYFEGSETVIVDLNETNDKIEIHLDGAILAKIDRAVLTPLQAPTEAKLPVLGVDNAIVWEPVSSFIGGGGGTKLYKHTFKTSVQTDVFLVSTRADKYQTALEIIRDFTNNCAILKGYDGAVGSIIFMSVDNQGKLNIYGAMNNIAQGPGLTPSQILADIVTEL